MFWKMRKSKAKPEPKLEGWKVSLEQAMKANARFQAQLLKKFFRWVFPTAVMWRS